MPKKKSFEEQLTDLETLAERMEKGDMPLEEALKAFEEGVKLARQCQNTLEKAELKVEKLVEQGDELFAESLEEEDVDFDLDAVLSDGDEEDEWNDD